MCYFSVFLCSVVLVFFFLISEIFGWGIFFFLLRFAKAWGDQAQNDTRICARVRQPRAQWPRLCDDVVTRLCGMARPVFASWVVDRHQVAAGGRSDARGQEAGWQGQRLSTEPSNWTNSCARGFFSCAWRVFCNVFF